MGQSLGNSKGKIKESECLGQSQKEIIGRFRDGKCNLLVATSVLEEGVDIPACNLVIRFDGLKTYCDYVQSKGVTHTTMPSIVSLSSFKFIQL